MRTVECSRLGFAAVSVKMAEKRKREDDDFGDESDTVALSHCEIKRSRTPSRKVVENLEASVQIQEERKREKRQADARRKARNRKLESLDVKEERLHKQACLQSTLRDQESSAQKQARLKKDADLMDLLHRKESPAQKQACLDKQAHLQAAMCDQESSAQKQARLKKRKREDDNFGDESDTVAL